MADASTEPASEESSTLQAIADAVAAGQIPTVNINTVERGRTLRAATEAMPASPRIYQRGGELVRVVEPPPPPEKATLVTATSKHIAPWTRATLTCELADVVRFEVPSSIPGQWTRSTPPGWLMSALMESKEWPRIPTLISIIETPTIDGDGEIVAPGYSRTTGLLFVPRSEPSPVPTKPTRDEALAAIEVLRDLIKDFPFVTEAHKSGWFAYLLTIVARYSFGGPTPLFWFDAPTKGTGKSTAERIAAIIATGAPSWTAQWAVGNPEEQNKVITTLARKAARVVCFDNLDRGAVLGGPGLCQVLTATTWSARLLGSNTDYTGPWTTVLAATANNAVLGPDMDRRVVHIRLESPLERPSERTDFKHKDIDAYVTEHQPKLLAAVLTILRAYHLAGRPAVELTPWGSYERWSAAVRAPLVWLGCPDPGIAVRAMCEQSSPEDQAGARVLAGLKRTAETALGGASEWTAARMHKALFERSEYNAYRLDTSEADDLRASLDELRPENAHGELNARAFAMLLAGLKGRTLDGLKIGFRISSGNRFWSVSTPDNERR